MGFQMKPVEEATSFDILREFIADVEAFGAADAEIADHLVEELGWPDLMETYRRAKKVWTKAKERAEGYPPKQAFSVNSRVHVITPTSDGHDNELVGKRGDVREYDDDLETYKIMLDGEGKTRSFFPYQLEAIKL
jgi:hypothetical protein